MSNYYKSKGGIETSPQFVVAQTFYKLLENNEMQMEEAILNGNPEIMIDCFQMLYSRIAPYIMRLLRKKKEDLRYLSNHNDVFENMQNLPEEYTEDQKISYITNIREIKMLIIKKLILLRAYGAEAELYLPLKGMVEEGKEILQF